MLGRRWRKEKEPPKVYLELSPEEFAALQKSCKDMTDAVNRASHEVSRSFQEGIKAMTRATDELKRTRTTLNKRK